MIGEIGNMNMKVYQFYTIMKLYAILSGLFGMDKWPCQEDRNVNLNHLVQIWQYMLRPSSHTYVT